MIGRTNATASVGFVRGGAVSLSHSTGASGMTDHGVVTMADGDYRLFEIKQSGTLSFSEAQLKRGIKADLFLANGGQGGDKGSRNDGGAGGGVSHLYGMLLENMTVVVGAAGAGATASNSWGVSGGVTSIQRAGDAIALPCPNGPGSGGGVGGETSAATMRSCFGDGVYKYPFNDAAFFLPHCGGAGGGGSYSPNWKGGRAARTAATATAGRQDMPEVPPVTAARAQVRAAAPAQTAAMRIITAAEEAAADTTTAQLQWATAAMGIRASSG